MRVSFIDRLKIISQTLMFVVIVAFVSGCYYLYEKQNVVMAQETRWTLPDFEHTNNQQFLDNVNQCVDYWYNTTTDIIPVNREILLAQAALESGWGNSRFALEGKNLFGMRTYDLTEPHMLPSNNPKKWGVKVYEHECDSVLHYINTLNNHHAYKKYRDLRDNGEDDPFILVETLEAYASDVHYFAKVKGIIKKIRKEYKLNFKG